MNFFDFRDLGFFDISEFKTTRIVELIFNIGEFDKVISGRNCFNGLMGDFDIMAGLAIGSPVQDLEFIPFVGRDEVFDIGIG